MGKPEPKRARSVSSKSERQSYQVNTRTPRESVTAAQYEGAGRTTSRPNPEFEKMSGWRSILNPLWCYHGFNGAVVVLTIFGLIMVFSSSSVSMISAGVSPWQQALVQSIYAIVGFICAVVAMHIKCVYYQKISLLVLCVAVVLQILTLTPMGIEVYGNRGWIGIGGFTLQPAEIVKLALCIWLPKSLMVAKRKYLSATDGWNQAKAYLFPVLGFVVALGSVLLGKDLGTGMIIIFIGLAAFLVGGFPGKWLALTVIGAVLVVGVAVFGSANRRGRIMAAYGECTDLQGVCYQSMHAKYALASGGLLGVGMGNSREKWNYLPAAHNDFIYAIIGEETGFVGAALVILLFVVLAWCMVVVANRIKNPYASCGLICFTTWLVGQALINIGVVLGIFPVIGVPMPFVSAGGSSLIMCLAAAGISDSMMRTQREIHAENAHI